MGEKELEEWMKGLDDPSPSKGEDTSEGKGKQRSKEP